MPTQNMLFWAGAGGSLQTYMGQTTLPLCYTQGLSLLVLCSDPGLKPPSSQVYKQQVRAGFQFWLQQLLAVGPRGSYLTTLWLHLLLELLWRGKNTWLYQNKFIVDNANPHPSEMVKVRSQVDITSSGEDISTLIRRSPWPLVWAVWALTSALPHSSSRPSTWLPTATYLQPPEWQSLDMFTSSSPRGDEGSKDSCGWCHPLEIDKNPPPVGDAQMVMNWSLKTTSPLPLTMFETYFHVEWATLSLQTS